MTGEQALGWAILGVNLGISALMVSGGAGLVWWGVARLRWLW